MAATEQFATGEKGAITLIGKVGTREVAHMLGELINEPDVDDIRSGLFTEMLEPGLVITLSIVDSNIILQTGIDSNSRRCKE